MSRIDLAVIAVYLVAIVATGLACRGRRGDVDEYFTSKGGFSGRIGVILVGLSIAATLFSGISFIVYTSSAYSNGAAIILGAVTIPIAWIALKFWFLPRYLVQAGNHPYAIIERRLGSTVRLCMSAMFVLLRLGWMGVMISAPTLVIMGAAKLGPEWFWPIVLTVGLSSTFYTAIGGIRGVIVTDALQFLIMAGGVAFVAGLILHRLDMPLGVIAHELKQGGMLQVLDFSPNLTKPLTVWAVLIGMSTAGIGAYASDLMMLQRYLAAGSPASSLRSFVVNMAGAVFMIVVLVAIGLLFWVWYRHNPDPNLPRAADKVFAYFIAHELPPGVSGLLLAAILAATMSSMTSGIIALAGTVTNDWLGRFGRPRTGAELFSVGQKISILIGVIATVTGGLASNLGTLFQMSQMILGVFVGPMLGCMIIALSPAKVRPRAMLVGLAAGTVAGWSVAASSLAVLWVSPVSCLVTIVVPLLAGAGRSRDEVRPESRVEPMRMESEPPTPRS